MKRKYLIILGVSLAILCVVAGLLISGVFDSARQPVEVTTQPDTSTNTDGSAIYSLSAFNRNDNIKLPLLPTDIDGYYYTMSVLGEVGFYQLDGATLRHVEATGKYDVEVVCSNINIPASVYYIDVDGKKFGCGLYTSSITPGVNLYAYAFFKLTELPDAFKNENEYWLLLDIDKTRFYSADKVYGEAFYYNVADNTSEHFLSETQRTIAVNGVYRPDYKVFTEEILKQSQDNVLFFSGRFYNEEDAKFDIFSSGGYDLNKDNLRLVKNVLDKTLFRAEDKFYYLTKNTEGEGFFLCSFNGEEETKEKLYAFDYENDCLRSGAYFYEKSASNVYGIVDGTCVQLNLPGIGEGFNANMFEISDNGAYAFLRGEDAEGKIWTAVSDMAAGKTNVFCNDDLAKIGACTVTNNGCILLTMADSLTATTVTDYYQLTMDISSGTATQVTTGEGETTTEVIFG